METAVKTLRVVLDDEDAAELERIAGDFSVSFELRRRLQRSLEEDRRPDIRRLTERVGALARMVEEHCGHSWAEHPATAQALRSAIGAYIARLGARDDVRFGPGELLSTPLVAPGVDDPVAIGIAVEGLTNALLKPDEDVDEGDEALKYDREKSMWARATDDERATAFVRGRKRRRKKTDGTDQT